MKSVALGTLIAIAVAACSPLRWARVRDDYDAVDKNKTKRIQLVVQPLPNESQEGGDLFGLVAQRYVNFKRNFLVMEYRAIDKPQVTRCECKEGFDGLLWLQPKMKQRGDVLEGSVEARLYRCGDGEEVWGASAEGAFAVEDALFEDITRRYVDDLGEGVAPYVAPAHNVLRPMLDTLPQPELTEEEVLEKIELEE